MRKILFLDIDGVLNNEQFYKECFEKKIYNDDLNPEKVRMLNSLDCEVVISSSWGCDNGQTWKKLRKKGFNLKVIGYIDHFYQNWLVRGNEIKKWLNENMKYEDYQYAILDDDGDMLLEQKDYFVQTNCVDGLMPEHIEKIKEILESDML